MLCVSCKRHVKTVVLLNVSELIHLPPDVALAILPHDQPSLTHLVHSYLLMVQTPSSLEYSVSYCLDHSRGQSEMIMGLAEEVCQSLGFTDFQRELHFLTLSLAKKDLKCPDHLIVHVLGDFHGRRKS